MSSPEFSDAEYLQRIRENLDDDTPRLVYADVLQERGDPLGEFIVVQCEKARLEREGKGYSPEHLRLLTREEDMRLAYENRWLVPYGLGFVDRNDFDRGFVSRAKVTADGRTPWERLCELPLREVVTGPSATLLGDLAALARHPSSLRLVTVRFGSQRATFDAPKLFELLREVDVTDTTLSWPGELPDWQILPALRGLSLYRPRPIHLEALAAESVGLEWLEGNLAQWLNADAIRAFAASKTFKKLTMLSLIIVDDDTAAAVFEADAPALRELQVSGYREKPFTADVANAFARASFVGELDALRTHLELDARVVKTLEERMPNVKRLAFDAQAAAGGIAALMASSSRVNELSLTAHALESPTVITSAPRERLTLQRFAMTAEDVRALPSVPRLDAFQCQWSDGAKAAVRERWPRAALT